MSTQQNKGEKYENYYTNSMKFVLDLMRSLTPKYDNTAIRFAKEEEEIYRNIMIDLQQTLYVEIKDNVLNIRWGQGTHPTKMVYSTPFYRLLTDVERTKKSIELYFKGPKSSMYDDDELL